MSEKNILLTKIQVSKKIKCINTHIKLCSLWQEKNNFYKNKELHNFDISNDQFNCRQIHARVAYKQPGFTYSASEPFTKHRERIQKFRE